MDPKKILKDQFLKIVDTQLEQNDPPQVRATFECLQSEGHDKETARLMIAQCTASEIRQVMTKQEPFDEARYIKCLNQLPKPPA